MPVTLINKVGVVSTNGSQVTTADIDTTGADFIIICKVYFSVNQVGPPFDNKGNVFTALTPQTADTDGSVQFWYLENAVVGPGHNFSTSLPGQEFPAMCVLAFSGIVLASANAAENGNNATSVSSIQTGLISTVSGQLIVTGVGGGQTSASIDSSFIKELDEAGVPAQNYGAAIAWKIATGASENPTWSIGGGPANTAAVIATFNVVDAGPTFSLMGQVLT